MARPRKQSLEQINQQIEGLRKMAATLRAREIRPEIARIRKVIAKYGLTPADLFGETGGRRAEKAASPRPSRARVGAEVKYRDPDGNTWSGRGRPPRWVVAARAAGKLDDYAV
ncbi:MAG: H-NS family nucleoid-associated regulatory protein [Lautropia sp.]